MVYLIILIKALIKDVQIKRLSLIFNGLRFFISLQAYSFFSIIQLQFLCDCIVEK